MPLAEMHRLFTEGGLTKSYSPLPQHTVAELLATHYGLNGELHHIDTEKDTTYRLTTSTTSYLVKISPPDEPIPVVLCQTDVIDWVEKTDPTIPVQSILRTATGKNHAVLAAADGTHIGVMRVAQFIPGTMLAHAAASATPQQLRQVGAMLARLDHALKDFKHQGIERTLVWNISNFPLLKPLLDYESDPNRRALAAEIFEIFDTRYLPLVPQIRKQIIHGDLSAYNTIVDPACADFITGVIDFGDVQHNPVIFDPAVLLANQLLPAPHNPWDVAGELFAGYQAAHPLHTSEIEALVIATIARVALRALVTNWRQAHVPERAAYLSSHSHEDWGRIENVMRYGIDESVQLLQQIAAEQADAAASATD